MGVPETPPTQAIFGKCSIDLKTAVRIPSPVRQFSGKIDHSSCMTAFSRPGSESCHPYSSVAFTASRQIAIHPPSCRQDYRYQILILSTAPALTPSLHPGSPSILTRTLDLHIVPSATHLRRRPRSAAHRMDKVDIYACSRGAPGEGGNMAST